MEAMAYELPRVGGVFLQMEDEIGSICACIGASLAGQLAMTATSGPGFSLMQEAIGYAIMVEAPLVIVDVMRAGPFDRPAHRPLPGRRHAGPLGHPRRSPRHRAGRLQRGRHVPADAWPQCASPSASARR